jgi:predicted RND superfamily exporter protein
MPGEWILFPVAVGLSLVAGYLFYKYRKSTVGMLDGLWRAFVAVIWMFGALITIAQGFVATGMIMLALFFSFFLKNTEHARNNYDGQGSSVRRRVGNWDPWWVRG